MTVRSRILAEFLGEQPVGTSILEVVACPGLGTAWRHFEEPPGSITWPKAQLRQKAIPC